MARVTAEEVEEIIDVSDDVPSLDPFIDAASNLVDDACGDSDYDSAKLKRIERWLAAHFVAIRDPRAASEGVASLSVKYRGKTDMKLDATIYGQQAMLIDTDGGLAALNERIKEGSVDLSDSIGVEWAGSDLSTAT